MLIIINIADDMIKNLLFSMAQNTNMHGYASKLESYSPSEFQAKKNASKVNVHTKMPDTMGSVSSQTNQCKNIKTPNATINVYALYF